MMPDGMFGLRVRFGDRLTEPTADFACRCGHTSAAQGAAAVRLFAETVAALHRQECTLTREMKRGDDSVGRPREAGAQGAEPHRRYGGRSRRRGPV